MTRKPPHPDRSKRLRKAALTIELLFVLPVLMVFLLGTVEFSMMFLTEQRLQSASREGARVAALGGSSDEVQQAVLLFLGTGSLSQASIDSVLTDSTGQPLPTGSPVAVTVSIPANQAVPDLLAFIGFSNRSTTLAAQSVMRKE